MRMEKVLDVYQRPYDERYPVVCLDESPRQLVEIKEERKADGTLLRDSEYIRRGVADIYMVFEPLAGKRYVRIEDNHNSHTWVKVVAALLDDQYRSCVRMTLVEDNLSAHRPAAFYEIFPPEVAKTYLERIEFVFTPAHGSWLDMAEIELSVLRRDCGESYATREALEQHIVAWQRRRNEKAVRANWQFTTADARVKLRKLYPTN
jgi:hypothetical protein